MGELVGKRCYCDFDLPSHSWPIEGFPAYVIVDAVDMPMVKMRSVHAGRPIWVNVLQIKTLRQAD